MAARARQTTSASPGGNRFSSRLLTLLLLVCLGYSPNAHAYGTIFLHEDALQAGTGLQPHSARIALFLLDGAVDLHIQLKTRGTADRVLWLVPVPIAPELSSSELALFEDLDEATRLRMVLPAPEGCPAPESSGCEDSRPVTPPSAGIARGATPPVIVFTPDFADTLQTTVLEAPSAAELRAWFEARGYVAPAEFEPALSAYPGWSFVLVEAEHGPNASGFEPLRIRYTGAAPTLPFRLTALSESPRVDALLLIASDRLYQPGGEAWGTPSTTGVRFDANGRSNYYEWLAHHTASVANGRWVTEFAGSVPGFGQLGRYYTRWSPHTLMQDPTVQERSDDAAFDGTIDLSSQPPLSRCGELVTERVPNRCAFNHCGADATCVLHDGAFACLCPSSQVAHWLEGPDENPHLVCAPAPAPMPLETTDSNCINGEALPAPVGSVCRCPVDWAALPREDGTLECLAVDPSSPRYGSGADRQSAENERAPAPARHHAGMWMGLLLLLIGGLLLSRDGAGQGLPGIARDR